MCEYCCENNKPLIHTVSGSAALYATSILMLDKNTIELNVSLNSANIVLEQQHIVYCPMCGRKLE